MARQDKKQADALNEILKGEHTAIKTYERYVKKVRDKEISKHLDDLLQDHKNHAAILATRIKELGIKPERTTGFSGVMASSMNTIKTLTNVDDSDILKELYNGENKGIAAALEIAEESLSDYDRQLIEEMMSEDYKHLNLLSTLLDKYQNKYLH